MKIEEFKDNLYFYIADDGYRFEEDGVNCGYMFVWGKVFPKNMKEVKYIAPFIE